MTAFSSLTMRATALGLAALVTLTALGTIDQLATEQHSATTLARAAAQQVQVSAGAAAAVRG